MTNPSSKKKVLVVDDDVYVRKMLSIVIESMDLECQLASDAKEGLDLIKAQVFDAMILDKNLPGMSGLDMADIVRRSTPDTPIIMITGYSSEDSFKDAAKKGIADFVKKPFELDDFENSLRRVLEGEKPLQSVIPPGASSVPDDVSLDMYIQKRDSENPPRLKEKGELSVVIIEQDDNIRAILSETIGETGCTVVPFSSVTKASGVLAGLDYNVLISRTDTLSAFKDIDSDDPIVRIAILDREGVDKTIEAIHAGATGSFAPPFKPAEVTANFKRLTSGIFF